ncbi:hypothetical protein NHU_02316 [Rhodovulum sulfidophilum]|uniref:Uncharacterized protein n=1 Tax=Rhodovulum sulfidophilum TaxID=35806 RepID=A0A0D6B2S0_RHOSU|nr:hypothetical protein NHU_02316 [Rhodovulum sulfidophilum]
MYVWNSGRKIDRYCNILEALAKKNGDALIASTSTKDEAYTLAAEKENEGLGDQNIYMIWGLESRGAIHFEEACALILALRMGEPDQQNFTVTFKRALMKNGKHSHEMMTVDMTRQQIIERLEWISSLKFGDDLAEWSEWMEIREAEGFLAMR